MVVEDNAINQAILGAFLRKRKIHYQIAKNGQEAIDKWKKGGFHLVLMDIQLPVKSGIEATKEIRHLEKLNRIGVFHENEIGKNVIINEEDRLTSNTFRSPVIIVALTASSNSSVDKTNALTAGCNDYLTKPVNLVWLQNKITEWGCMQALIDFDGWKDKNRRLNKA
ncbi:Signal transduction histidine-protein kinase BarA [Chlamydia trachomatis]|nr:Signal transduction histidine-protein kinase BarA [Chlamydia trachomatis]